MSSPVILDFPVLQHGGGNFKEDVSYEVSASHAAGKLTITHELRGRSFIYDWVKSGDAVFSVSLLYRDSSERQAHEYKISAKQDERDNKIIAKQIIDNQFSYAPEIMPSIVVLKSKEVVVGDNSGLTNFWQSAETFCIQPYARIALAARMQFTSGDVSNLMKIVEDKNLAVGEMRVVVNEHANEADAPVTLWCGQGVYDQLRKMTQASAKNSIEALRSAIVTNALCAVYADVKNLADAAKEEVNGVLLAHLNLMHEQTGQDWQADDFDPSLAATKMQPYATDVLIDGNEDG